MRTLRISQYAFAGVAAVLLAGSTALTVAWCAAMSTMHAMPMPGGWSMSMMWMRMPGQTWPGSALSFLAMWLAMTMAMMLPVLLPTLWRYRRAVEAAAHPDALATRVAIGYFLVWMFAGTVAFAAGSLLANLEMHWTALAHAAPTLAGVVVFIAGAAQFSAWKTRHLAYCRAAPECCDALDSPTRAAWRYGLRLGLRCVHCCFGLSVVLLVVGMMDLQAMALVTAAIGAERLAPGGLRAARFVGIVLLVVGACLIARAVTA